MRYAYLDLLNVVINIILADQAFVDASGEPDRYVIADLPPPKKSAAIGDTWDPELQEFVPPTPVQPGNE